jgi:hypothetical protein
VRERGAVRSPRVRRATSSRFRAGPVATRCARSPWPTGIRCRHRWPSLVVFGRGVDRSNAKSNARAQSQLDRAQQLLARKRVMACRSRRAATLSPLLAKRGRAPRSSRDGFGAAPHNKESNPCPTESCAVSPWQPSYLCPFRRPLQRITWSPGSAHPLVRPKRQRPRRRCPRTVKRASSEDDPQDGSFLARPCWVSRSCPGDGDRKAPRGTSSPHSMNRKSNTSMSSDDGPT